MSFTVWYSELAALAQMDKECEVPEHKDSEPRSDSLVILVLAMEGAAL
jgi:hypothetical protein